MNHYDPHSPDFATNGIPFEQLAFLRREAPVSVTVAGAWYLSRRDDIEELLKDVAHFQGDMTTGTGIDGIQLVEDDWLFLPEIPVPAHRPVRRLYNAALGGHRTGKLAPYVREICDELVDGFDTSAPIDMQAEYAIKIPGVVIAEILGVPAENADNFMRWASDGTIMMRPGCPGYGPDGPEIDIWFKELVRQQKADGPTSPVVEAFLLAEVDGAPFSENRIAAQLHNFVMAGVHTTRTLLVHTVQRMLFDPTLFEMLRTDRSLVSAFVEESLRHDSPAQRVTRLCLADTEVAGVQIKRGDYVEVGIASGNRDEAYVDDPETFRLDRPNPKDHVAFGAGAHVCPGAGLARLEGVTAVETLLDRVAEMRPVRGHEYPPIPCSFSYAPVLAFVELS